PEMEMLGATEYPMKPVPPKPKSVASAKSPIGRAPRRSNPADHDGVKASWAFATPAKQAAKRTARISVFFICTPVEIVENVYMPASGQVIVRNSGIGFNSKRRRRFLPDDPRNAQAGEKPPHDTVDHERPRPVEGKPHPVPVGKVTADGQERPDHPAVDDPRRVRFAGGRAPREQPGDDRRGEHEDEESRDHLAGHEGVLAGRVEEDHARGPRLIPGLPRGHLRRLVRGGNAGGFLRHPREDVGPLLAEGAAERRHDLRLLRYRPHGGLMEREDDPG